jgi:hypothetical protein
MMIDSWTDGFVALRDRAYEARGATELDSGAKWPRTTGDDVVTIAALFDASVRDSATPGFSRRWRGTLDQIKHEALPAPSDAFADNRSFWSTLEIAAVTLDEHAYPVPPDATWTRLLREVGTEVPRNGGALTSITQRPDPLDVYAVLYREKRAERGDDVLAPPRGFGGLAKPIPRTTNADVLFLATWWTNWLADSPRIRGVDSIQARWLTALAGVDGVAKQGHPSDVYPLNNEFWRTFGSVAAYMSAADAVSHSYAQRNVAPPPFGPFPEAKGFDEVYNAQEKLLGQQRGADTLAPPSGFDGITKPIPRTTNADVLQLAVWWDARLSDAPHAMGADTVATLWHATLSDVNTLAKQGAATDVYAKNNEFWRTLGKVSIQIAAATEMPSTWDLAVDSVKDSVSNLPETLGQAASSAAHAVGGAAVAVGNGLLDVLKKPLYLGLGLVGLYLVTRNRGEH